jgi:hypothetical protein
MVAKKGKKNNSGDPEVTKLKSLPVFNLLKILSSCKTKISDFERDPVITGQVLHVLNTVVKELGLAPPSFDFRSFEHYHLCSPSAEFYSEGFPLQVLTKGFDMRFHEILGGPFARFLERCDELLTAIVEMSSNALSTGFNQGLREFKLGISALLQDFLLVWTDFEKMLVRTTAKLFISKNSVLCETLEIVKSFSVSETQESRNLLWRKLQSLNSKTSPSTSIFPNLEECFFYSHPDQSILLLGSSYAELVRFLEICPTSFSADNPESFSLAFQRTFSAFKNSNLEEYEASAKTSTLANVNLFSRNSLLQ